MVVAQITRVPEATRSGWPARPAGYTGRTSRCSCRAAGGPRAQALGPALRAHVAQLHDASDTRRPRWRSCRITRTSPRSTRRRPGSPGMLRHDRPWRTSGRTSPRCRQGDHVSTMDQAPKPDGAPGQITVHGASPPFQWFQFSDDPKFQALLTAAAARRPASRHRGARGGDRPAARAGARRLDQDVGAVPGRAPADPPYTGAGAAAGRRAQRPGQEPGRGLRDADDVGGYSNGQLPLEIYNNWVRWIWVYVQYLGADNANLSLNANPTWPDTAYCKSVGLLTEVSTILGVPIWNDNRSRSRSTTPRAPTPRASCSAGSAPRRGSGWRQYFPAAPTRAGRAARVHRPRALTGISRSASPRSRSPGLDGSLAADAIEEPVSELAQPGQAIVTTITDLGIPVGEAVAVATASGTRTARPTARTSSSSCTRWRRDPEDPLQREHGRGLGQGRRGDHRRGGGGEDRRRDPDHRRDHRLLAVVGDVMTLAEICAESASRRG